MSFRRKEDHIDALASDDMQVEIMPEVGWPGRYKLYVHVGGITVIRICKLEEHQIDVHGFRRTG